MGRSDDGRMSALAPSGDLFLSAACLQTAGTVLGEEAKEGTQVPEQGLQHGYSSDLITTRLSHEQEATSC